MLRTCDRTVGRQALSAEHSTSAEMQRRFRIGRCSNAFPRPDVQPFSCLGCVMGKGGADHVQAFIMGQVEMQRGYGDVIVSRGLQIGSVIRCMDSAAKPKPVIRKAARVSALYYAGATIVMEALTDRFDTPHRHRKSTRLNSSH